MSSTTTTIASVTSGATPLDNALLKLYEMAGGSRDSGNVQAAQLTTARRMEFFRSDEFRAWVASEKAAGRQIFWLKDVDKTQGAGDVFSFFFKWRADNHKFLPEQLEVIAAVLRDAAADGKYLGLRRFGRKIGCACGYKLATADGRYGPEAVISSWLANEDGGKGLGMMDFWSRAYWPSQFGLTKEQKLEQVQAFAPSYAARVYPGVRKENELLEELGVNVVIVSNGDQELAIACAPYLGVKPENVVGSHLIYGQDGLSTGVNHTYEVTGSDWHARPQPGKPLSFHYWLHDNRARFGWDNIDERKFVIAGRDGDSASTDGGMMMLMQAAAIGNFMINTPGEPKRIAQFYSVASKYGWTKGQFITLNQLPSELGFRP
jgi:hypothetical protein